MNKKERVQLAYWLRCNVWKEKAIIQNIAIPLDSYTFSLFKGFSILRDTFATYSISTSWLGVYTMNHFSELDLKGKKLNGKLDLKSNKRY
jgi:hypothetical protein